MPRLLPRDTTGTPSRKAWVGAFLIGIGVTLLVYALRQGYWYLTEYDGYYHMRVAAWMRENGWAPRTLPWTRFSVFTEQYGDKEWLFHWLLMAFAGGDLLSGGKAALSVLNGITAFTLAYLGFRRLGGRGWLYPAIVFSAGPMFLLRMEYLRPHILSLVLLLWMAWAMAMRCHRVLLVLNVVYALAYTAFHAPPLLGLAAFFWLWINGEGRDHRLYLYPLVGAMLGTVVHPQFPDNLAIWAIQNYDYYIIKASIPKETEADPLTTFAWLRWNSPGLMLGGALFALRYPWRMSRPADRWEKVLHVFAGAMLMLFFKSVRFAEYAVPFGALLGIEWWRRLDATRGIAAGRPRLLAVCTTMGTVLSAVLSFSLLQPIVARLNSGFTNRQDFEAFGRAIPDGAHVASPWDHTSHYMMAAPQARYLNVLDPIYMFVRNPEYYKAIEKTFSGLDPDPSSTFLAGFDSNYVAFHRMKYPALTLQIERDPRFAPVWTSMTHVLYRIIPEHASEFRTGWRWYAGDYDGIGDFMAQRASRSVVAFEDERVRLPIQSWVSPPPGLMGKCVWAVHRREESDPNLSRTVEFSSAGPFEIFLDNRHVVSGDGGQLWTDAVVVDWESPLEGRGEAVVRVCKGQMDWGFSWRETDPSTSPAIREME